jgi:hypothetical protein
MEVDFSPNAADEAIWGDRGIESRGGTNFGENLQQLILFSISPEMIT